MKNRFAARALALVLFASLITACTTFEVEGSGSIAPNSITGSETVHSSLYGFRWAPHTIEKCDTANLFRVEYHTNAAFLLASVATLGLYVPQTVEWWCTAPTDDQDEEVWDPMENAIMDGGR
ncbi:MAG: hypothetical protein AAFN07_14515 [Pseudomonadota bacterium]